MKKRIIALVLCIFTMLSLCGCKMAIDVKMNKDGSAKFTTTMQIEESTITQMGVSAADMKEAGYKSVTIDGTKYYQMVESEKMSKSEIKEEYNEMTAKYCYFGTDDAEKSMTDTTDAAQLGMSEEELANLKKSMECTMSVTFPYKVSKTNGTLSKDKKTVTWDLLSDIEYAYAYTTKYSDEKAPEIKGVKDGSTYTEAVKVKYTDDSAIKSAKLDGKAIKSGKKVSKKGEHTVVVTDVFDNKSTVTFTIK